MNAFIEMVIDFEKCGLRFSANATEGESLGHTWGWNNTIIGLDYNYTHRPDCLC
jgi:hypothetical protein